MTKLGTLCIILALGVVGFSPLASAQNKAEEQPAAKSYDFSGDDIDGELVRPDGEFIDPRQFAEHTSLIRVRTDFIKEITKSAEDL